MERKSDTSMLRQIAATKLPSKSLNQSMLGRPPESEPVLVIGENVRKVGVGNPGKAQFRGWPAGRAPGQIVFDLHDCIVRPRKIVQHHLAHRRKGPSQRVDDLRRLA